MVGLIEILILLFCVYLVFKGVEIFQLGYMTHEDHSQRQHGIALGFAMIVAAILTSIGAFYLMANIVRQIGEIMPPVGK